MAHPLDGVRLKIVRAQQHLDEVIEITKPFEVGECRILPEKSADGKLVLLVVHLPPVPEMLAVVIGDCLFNLRSALDHIVWQLAKINSAIPSNRAAFPIEAAAADFERAKARRLSGVSVEAKAVIETLQPYHGGDNPLGLLALLHNIDKHRRLNLTTAVATDTSLLWTRNGSLVYQSIIASEEFCHGANLGVGIVTNSEAGRQLLADDVKVHGEAAMFIAFDDPTVEDRETSRVDTSLKQILDFIRDRVVPSFEPFFD